MVLSIVSLVASIWFSPTCQVSLILKKIHLLPRQEANGVCLDPNKRQRECPIDCQTECQRDCLKVCQNKRQTECQIEFQRICQKECQIECQNRYAVYTSRCYVRNYVRIVF